METIFWPGFQFLGIPPKGELDSRLLQVKRAARFQFLGIPPKGEHLRLQPRVNYYRVSNF